MQIREYPLFWAVAFELTDQIIEGIYIFILGSFDCKQFLLEF